MTRLLEDSFESFETFADHNSLDLWIYCKRITCVMFTNFNFHIPNEWTKALPRTPCLYRGDAQQSRVCSTNDRPLCACTIPCPPDTFQQRHSIHFHDSISAWGFLWTWTGKWQFHVIPQTSIHFASRNVKASWAFRCQSAIITSWNIWS